MNPEDFARGLAALSRGTVVAAATETLFGLLADARDAAAIDRVFALKGRDATKGSALLLPSRAAWASLVTAIPESAARLADHFWPGPLTIALPARPELDARLVVDGTVGVRLPGASHAAELASAFGAPLTATSANPAGQPPCVTSEAVAAAFQRSTYAAELVIVSGRAPGGTPSTLVIVDGDRVRVVREGAVSKRDLDAVVPGCTYV